MTLIPFIFVWVSYLPILAFKLLQSSIYASCCTQHTIINHIAVFSYFTQKKSMFCLQKKTIFDLCFDIGSLLALIGSYTLNNFEPTWSLFFISAMLLVIHTDSKTLLISSFTSLYLIPISFILSYFQKTDLSITSSITGALFGFLILYLPHYAFKKLYKQNGIGSGDFDLLAYIGSFTGALGVWVALSIGSISGTIVIGAYQLFTKRKIKHIPLGSFLAIGAITFTLFPKLFVNFFLS